MSVENCKQTFGVGVGATVVYQPAQSRKSSPVVTSEETVHGNDRDTVVSIMSVDSIVDGATVPLQSPWTTQKNFSKWSSAHPAKVGEADRLTLHSTFGPEGKTEMLRNGQSEFCVTGTQGRHDSDHIFFQSAFEQLGGKPIVSASPLNEIVVNDFEWVGQPPWRDGRVSEINQLRQKDGLAAVEQPTDQQFVEFQAEVGQDGVRQILHQTLAQSKWARAAFDFMGRPLATFPSPRELDWSMRAIAGSTKPFSSVKQLVQEFSTNGLQVARVVERHCPQLFEQAQAVGRAMEERVDQGTGAVVVRSFQLPAKPEMYKEAAPFIAKMNEIAEQIPAIYRHGMSGPSGPLPAQLQLEQQEWFLAS